MRGLCNPSRKERLPEPIQVLCQHFEWFTYQKHSISLTKGLVDIDYATKSEDSGDWMLLQFLA